MTRLNKDKAPFSLQIPWQLLQASCWHLICSISFPWPNCSHAEAFTRLADTVALFLYCDVKLFWSGERVTASPKQFIPLSMSQSLWWAIKGETKRSRSGRSPIISCNLKWIRHNLFFCSFSFGLFSPKAIRTLTTTQLQLNKRKNNPHLFQVRLKAVGHRQNGSNVWLFGASFPLSESIFTHPAQESDPVTSSSQLHSSWQMTQQWSPKYGSRNILFPSPSCPPR